MLNYTDILGFSEVHTFFSLELHKRVEFYKFEKGSFKVLKSYALQRLLK